MAKDYWGVWSRAVDRPFDLWNPCWDLRLGARPVRIVLDPMLHGPVNQNDSKLFMGDALSKEDLVPVPCSKDAGSDRDRILP